MQVLELPYATMRYEAPVIYVTYTQGAALGFLEVRELIKSAEELAGHQPYVVLSDVRAGITVTPMGKKVVSDLNELPLHCGSAVLLENTMMQLAANFFDKLKPSPYPFKAFTSKKKALEWLLTLPLKKHPI